MAFAHPGSTAKGDMASPFNGSSRNDDQGPKSENLHPANKQKKKR